MRYGQLDRVQTGVALPLAALRSAGSCGVGEFRDLVPLARWCAEVGFDLIQILPIQDTGDDPSPYGAMSAFALHPLYLHLDGVPGIEPFAGEIAAARARLEASSELDYTGVLSFKLDLLRRAFVGRDREGDTALWHWAEERAWLRPYALFRQLRQRHDRRPWPSWGEWADPSEEALARLWSEGGDDLLFHLWLQRELERQLGEAVAQLSALGVRLEGDLPILLNEDSADVWRHPELFDRQGRAGAPPDMYSRTGQNWGFPCYRWDEMRRQDYRWWRERLRRADRFFHAVRLDHVLGFFRIWRVPAADVSALSGRFDPALPIARQELRSCGFDDEQIDRFAAPAGSAHGRHPSESEILAMDDPGQREAWMARLRDRILLPADDSGERFRPFWFWAESPQFQRLSPRDQGELRRLMEVDGERQERLWEEVGRRHLRMLQDSADMLLCAEDLGAVPRCVPPVLAELGLLGLKVERWLRQDGRPGAPFLHPREYPRLSVCSPTVHDTSTLRGWWQEDAAQRRDYARELGVADPPARLSVELTRRILQRNLEANSLFTVLAIQDVLALCEDLRIEDPSRERINVPGTPSGQNWRYRLPVGIERLAAHDELGGLLRAWTEARRGRPLG